MMNEEAEAQLADALDELGVRDDDEVAKAVEPPRDAEQHSTGVIRDLDGQVVGDEFAQDAVNYQILLGKIEALLERLGLDA
jgi:ankyrin repeat/BTB/POZ domain-containing protein 1